VRRRNLDTREIVARYPIENAPSCEQGFGRLELTRTLPLDSVDNAPDSILVYDGEELSEPGTRFSKCIAFASSKEVRATLVYADPASDETSNGALQSILKLLVSASDFSWRWPYVEQAMQATNNVQRMVLRKPREEASPMQVNVTAERVPMEAQPFTLVVTGDGLAELPFDQCNTREAAQPSEPSEPQPEEEVLPVASPAMLETQGAGRVACGVVLVVMLAASVRMQEEV
jgi:hypothetical protein